MGLEGEMADHQVMHGMAAECRQLAAGASDPARRAYLLEVAGHYERMAAALEVLARPRNN
jgi:hypothetical protein